MGRDAERPENVPTQSMGTIRKSEDIQLYAVSTRYPEKLFSEVSATEVTTGVFEIKVISREIRILVLSRLPLSQLNAVLAFSVLIPERCCLHWRITNGRWMTEAQ